MQEELNMRDALKHIPMGLTSYEWRDFLDLLPQANDMQLEVMIKQIKQEMERRK